MHSKFIKGHFPINTQLLIIEWDIGHTGETCTFCTSNKGFPVACHLDFQTKQKFLKFLFENSFIPYKQFKMCTCMCMTEYHKVNKRQWFKTNFLKYITLVLFVQFFVHSELTSDILKTHGTILYISSVEV